MMTPTPGSAVIHYGTETTDGEKNGMEEKHMAASHSGGGGRLNVVSLSQRSSRGRGERTAPSAYWQGTTK